MTNGEIVTLVLLDVMQGLEPCGAVCCVEKGSNLLDSRATDKLEDYKPLR